MGSKIVDGATLNLDTKVLSNFIYEWNISRRHILAYPEGHPIIAQAASKVLRQLDQLLEFRSAFTLGIAKDTLLIGNSFFDRRNPVYKDFAQALFGAGIASFTVRRGMTPEELYRFNRILTCQRDEIRDSGGIEQALIDAEIRHIMVEAIDYGAFRATEEEAVQATDTDRRPGSESLWDGFIHGLMQKSLDPDGGHIAVSGGPDPATLAEWMNHHQGEKAAGRQKAYQETISDFIRQLDAKGLDRQQRNAYLDKLGNLVQGLNPHLRRQFLNSTFRSLGDRRETAEEVIRRLPDEVVLDALADVNARRSAVPPVVLDLLGKLARHGTGTGTGRTPDRQAPAPGDVENKLQVIFREEESESFVPEGYQELLREIVVSESLSSRELDEIGLLKDTLSGHCVETQVSSVILELLRGVPDPEQIEALKRNLLDLCGYFLEIGDFPSLVAMHRRLVAEHGDVSGDGLRQEVLSAFAESEFLETVLDDLGMRGKPKYEEIAALIREVGGPFIEPMMNRLAAEASMSLRRYYMARLEELGHLARDAAILRLRDQRWYFVRNLVISLRNLNDPSVVEPIRELSEHPKPQVRLEVMRALLHYNDAEANRILLKDLASAERERQLNAIQLAERSRSPEVFQKLLDLLTQRGFTGPALERKKMVIRTLAEIGSPQALPALGEIFNARPMLNQKNHQLLKMEVLRFLDRYPAESVTWVLERLAASSDQTVARVAGQTLGRLQGRT